MTKVRILTNTRLNRVFYGRDSLIEVSASEAARLASIGIGEPLYINNLDESDREEEEKPVDPEPEQPKAAAKPKAKKAVKK